MVFERRVELKRFGPVINGKGRVTQWTYAEGNEMNPSCYSA